MRNNQLDNERAFLARQQAKNLHKTAQFPRPVGNAAVAARVGIIFHNNPSILEEETAAAHYSSLVLRTILGEGGRKGLVVKIP